MDILQFYPMNSKKIGKRKTKELKESKDLIKKIGKRIKEFRDNAGYTNAEKFAFEHDFTRSQYANWEAGQDMLITSIYRIAKAHGLTLAEFFAGIE